MPIMGSSCSYGSSILVRGFEARLRDLAPPSHALAPLEVLPALLGGAHHLLPDVLGWPEERDGDVVVPPLEERLALEVDEAVLAGAEEDADQLVADAHVDLEEAAERDGAHGGSR